jgi:excinuclease ABC subunit C
MTQSHWDSLKDIVRNIPHKPGVYRYYGEDDQLLYIGKAKDLKNRVSSYFQEGRPKNQRLTLMISQITRIEYTVVESEKESLILEANLIHELQPKYNIQLKDDRSYVHVRFNYRDPIPSITLTRRKYDPKSDYFGPYTKRSGISQTLRTLRTIFPYCQVKYPQDRPCNYVGIKQCDGICIGWESMDDYLAKLEQIKGVLQGKTDDVEEFIQAKINAAIEIHNYELAALWRDRLKMLQETVENQKVILPQPQDLDLVTLVWQVSEEGLMVGSVVVQSVRAGKVVNINNFLMTGSEDLEEMGGEDVDGQLLAQSFLQKFMANYYQQSSDKVDVLVQAFTVEES